SPAVPRFGESSSHAPQPEGEHPETQSPKLLPPEVPSYQPGGDESVGREEKREPTIGGPTRLPEPDFVGLYTPGAPVGVRQDAKLTQVGVAEALGRLVMLPSECERLSRMDRSGRLNLMLASSLRTTIGLAFL